MAKVYSIHLGDRVRHKFVPGYTGIVTAVTEYLNGCRRISIQPTKLKDHMPLKEGFFDEVELAIVKRGAYRTGSQENGGPRPVPPRIERAQ